MVDIRPDKPIPMATTFPKCPECGFHHPPASPGECPVAHGERVKNDRYSKLVANILRLLNTHEDGDRLATMLEKTIQAWQIQWMKQKKSELGDKV